MSYATLAKLSQVCSELQHPIISALERENEELREQLRVSQEDNARVRAQNEALWSIFPSCASLCTVTERFLIETVAL